MENKYPIITEYKESGLVGRCWMGDSFWYEQTLWEYTKDLEVFDMPLASFDLNYLPWKLDNMEDIAHHMYRVNKADLNYAIILNSLGGLLDGAHRIIKAILNERETIKAVRIKQMPYRDGVKEN